MAEVYESNFIVPLQRFHLAISFHQVYHRYNGELAILIDLPKSTYCTLQECAAPVFRRYLGS